MVGRSITDLAREVSLTQEPLAWQVVRRGGSISWHLDGEIYLRAGTRPAPTDINGDCCEHPRPDFGRPKLRHD